MVQCPSVHLFLALRGGQKFIEVVAICSHLSHTIFPILPELVLTHGRRYLANPPHCINITNRVMGRMVTNRVMVNWEGQLGRSTEVNWEELNNHNVPNEGRRVRAVRAKSCTKQRALDPKMTKDDDPDVMVTAYNKAILS